MSRRATSGRALVRTWLVPTLIATACLVGLVVGLLGGGLNDVLAAAGLGLPLVVVGWAIGRRR